MLSGVGPAEHLAKFNISIVRDLPGVGAHLVDHPVVDLNFKDRLNKSLRSLRPSQLMDFVFVLYAAMQYTIWRTGPLASNVSLGASRVSYSGLLLTIFPTV
jgi:choline dehydrogenase